MLELFMLCVFALPIAFFTCDIRSLVVWREGWRIVAGLIGVTYCLLLARIIIEISARPTSHNMWPFEVIIWSALAFTALGVVALFRWIVNRQQAQS